MNFKIKHCDITFESLAENHRISIIDIYNYYIENEYSAYLEEKVNYDHYDNFLPILRNYPAYVIKLKEKHIGFCFLNAYHPSSSFKDTAVITYFIDKDYKRKGIGSLALNKLENEARKKGIHNILANISSVNKESLAFHTKNGFQKCGEFKNIIKKKNSLFSIVWMQKSLD